MLRILSEKKRYKFNNEHLNTIRPALMEAENDNSIMYGFTDNYIKVAVPYNPDWVNTIKPVLLDKLSDFGHINAIEQLQTVESD